MPTLKLRIGLPSKRTMGSICICGALASISSLAYMRWSLEDQVRQTVYYQLAIQQLRQHLGAVGLLGEPIKELGFNVSNEKNRCDCEKAQLQVTVEGSKDKGTVYFWATNNYKKGWLIERLELETKQHPYTRFLLKKPHNFSLVNSDGNLKSQDTKVFMEVQQKQKLDEIQQQSVSEVQEQGTYLQQSIKNNLPQELRKRQRQKKIQSTEGGRIQ
ncbi:hypothetical protein KR009_006993 [Drosophila setifemur]|nr:hypothetical protein KR009_006993 [Drosophila setifemur]